MTTSDSTTTPRQVRIERLLKELEYEVTRGMMEREIDETLTFQFCVPVSQCIPGGMVRCRFVTRPVTGLFVGLDDYNTPKLKVVSNDAQL